jgi:Ca2+-binding EF-hand superfamily protein
MSVSRQRWGVVAVAIASFLVVSPVDAQQAGAPGKPGGPPAERKGPPPGKGPPGFLRQLDVNRDGLLDTEELSEQARPVLERAVRAMGGDLRKGIAVEGVEEAVAAAVSKQSLPADPRTRQLTDELMRQFDADGDGRITREEWKSLEETTGWKGGGGHRKADFDYDEQIAPAELALWITMQDPVNRGGDPKGPKGPPPAPPGSPSGAPSARPPAAGTSTRSNAPPASPWEGRRSYRFLPPSERLPKGLPDWFAQKDINRDGQVMMAEYATQWTNDTAEEFQKQDLNNDGVITSEECLKALGLWAGRSTSAAAMARMSASTAIARSAPPRPDATMLVKRYDANTDGLLDKDEWKAMEHAEGLKGGGGHKKADQDRDDRINPAELDRWLASRPQH